MEIIVNGRRMEHGVEYNSTTVFGIFSYESVVRLANKDPSRIYTVTYSYGKNHDGTLVPGEDVAIGAIYTPIFNVADTGSA